jgi:hypothetical protein
VIAGVPFLDDLGRIKYELELFRLGGQFELFEEGRHVGTVEPGCSEAAFSYRRLVLSCWGEGWSRSWRVTGCQVSSNRLLLRCAKSMGVIACLLELRRGDIERLPSREEFSRKLPSLIESSLPGLRVERAISSRDDRAHLSSAHTRLIIKAGRSTVAAVATGSSEPQSSIDALLGAGIVWLDALRKQAGHIGRLMIFAPKGRATAIATRLTAVRGAGADISLYELEEACDRITPVAAFDQGDLIDNYRRFARRAIWPRRGRISPESEKMIEAIIRVAPGVIETRHRSGFISFSIRGLEFARASRSREKAWFGVFERERLEPGSFERLAGLASAIISSRTAETADRNDWLYRAQPERWLESMIRLDITAIDPALDPRWVYSQVPAYRGEQRGYIDLLASTREGRLVVIELKVAEDAEFPFQGLDYWLRVEWHRLRGDFERRGYFEGMEIQDRPPLLYLVAPVFCFHTTTRLIAGSISEPVQIYRIGINDDWRAGVRALLHERLN